MPALTRRRSTDAREESWPVYFGDVHVGTVAERTGNPHDTEPWEWQTAIHCLTGAAEGRDFLMHARIGVLRAINWGKVPKKPSRRKITKRYNIVR